MNKAQRVVRAFGGATRLSKMTNIPRSTICMWMRDKPTGCGGRIPDKHQRKIARLALDHGLDINQYIVDEK